MGQFVGKSCESSATCWTAEYTHDSIPWCALPQLRFFQHGEARRRERRLAGLPLDGPASPIFVRPIRDAEILSEETAAPRTGSSAESRVENSTSKGSATFIFQRRLVAGSISIIPDMPKYKSAPFEQSDSLPLPNSTTS